MDAWRPPASTAYRLEWTRERIRDRSPQVARRLLAAYQALERGLGPGRRAAVRSRQAALREESAGRGVSPAILRPDSMGLG